MEILRARRDHPDTKPEDYAKVDQDFAAFMKCESSELGVHVLCC